MSLDLLKKDIASKSFGKIYCICGDETYLMRFYFGELKKAILPTDDNLVDLVVREGETLKPSELSDILSTFAMVSEHKVLVINDLMPSDDAAQYLINHSDELNEGVVVIVYNFTVKPDERTKEYKAFQKMITDNGIVVKIDFIDKPTLRRWVAKQVGKHDCKIDSETVEYLLSQVSNEMDFLNNEIDKYCSYCDGTVTREIIDLLAIKTSDARVYDVTDGIFDHNRAKVFETLKTLSDMHTNGMLILGSIFASVTNLYKVSVMSEEGISSDEISRITGMKDFAVRRLLQRSGRIKRSQIEKAMKLCAEADINSKSTSVNVDTIISELVNELIYVL